MTFFKHLFYKYAIQNACFSLQIRASWEMQTYLYAKVYMCSTHNENIGKVSIDKGTCKKKMWYINTMEYYKTV